MIRDATIKYLTTAGSRINCLRCTAKSSRTKQQCGKPALKSSKTQKCGHHGGLSTSPKTAEGRQRIADELTVHGRDTKAERLERSRKSLELAQLEDAMYVLAMASATLAGVKAAMLFLQIGRRHIAFRRMESSGAPFMLGSTSAMYRWI